MRKAIKRRRRAGVRTCSRSVGEALESRLLLTAGSFDLTFGGGDGGVTAGFPGTSTYVHDSGEAMAVRPDGKVVVAGYTGDGSNTNNSPAVARFTADGLLDTTFNGDGTPDGMVSYPVGADTEVRAVALQGDGKIVLAGTTKYQAGNTWDWFVMRLNENGSLDTTFGGGDGFFTLDFGFGYGDDAHAVAIQSDGKIVVTGVGSQNTSQLATIRLTATGALDPTFSGDGIDMVDFFGGVDYASDVTVDPDGKIVVAGGSVPPGGNRQFVLLRYLTNGTLDTSFDGDGMVSTSFGAGQSAMGRQILRQGDGKYVVGGLVGTSSVAPYAVARYNANGSLDTTFGTNSAVPGTTLIPSVQGHIFVSYGIARQADGKLLFGGYSEVSTPSLMTYFTAVRLTDTGAPDATFGSGGIKQVSVPGSSAGASDGADLAIAADGNILLAGAAWVNGQNDFGLVKLKAAADTGAVSLNNGVLTVTGTDDANTLNLSATSTTFTAVLDGVTYTFPAASVTSINVDLKGGDDVENHNGNVPGGTVTLGDGNDTLTVGTGNKVSPALNVSGGLGNDTVTLGVAFFTPTNFTGDGGTDTLVYNGAQGNDDLVVTASDITNGGSDRATYATVEAVRVLGNFGYDSMRLTGVASGTSYQLDGGAGNDTITVRHATYPDGFYTSSPVTLIGGADVDEIAFDDSANNVYGDAYAITPTTFTRTALVTFAYQSAETLRVTCGSGDNPITVTPSNATKVVVDGGLNPSGYRDTLTVSLAGATGTAFTPLANGSGRYTFTNFQPVEFSGVELDKTLFPPTVASAQFTYQTRQSITFTFSEDVVGTLSPSDVVVTNLTTGQTIPAGSFIFDGSSPIGMQSVARWHAVSPLPDGNYTATLPAGSVADPAGNKLAADYTLSFFILAGDANRDRVVNFDDLLVLAKNYNKTAATFDQGDFNYDTVVNFDDLLLQAKNYNKSIPAPAPAIESAAPVLAAATSSSILKDDSETKQVFSTTRVARPTAPKPPKAAARPTPRR